MTYKRSRQPQSHHAKYDRYGIRRTRDEIGGLGGGDINAEGALAYQRYHEAMIRKDGSEISMIHAWFHALEESIWTMAD